MQEFFIILSTLVFFQLIVAILLSISLNCDDTMSSTIPLLDEFWSILVQTLLLRIDQIWERLVQNLRDISIQKQLPNSAHVYDVNRLVAKVIQTVNKSSNNLILCHRSFHWNCFLYLFPYLVHLNQMIHTSSFSFCRNTCLLPKYLDGIYRSFRTFSSSEGAVTLGTSLWEHTKGYMYTNVSMFPWNTHSLMDVSSNNISRLTAP